MIFESLNISLKSSYQKPSKENPYQAKLEVSYSDNRMTVALQPETIDNILHLVANEIASAAQIQINDFVQSALSINHHDALEHKAIEKPEMNF